ncbi:hypothetical protein [Amycolatopsis sp.]|uniref:hypothetical protein n=1 Tax=Amycolatopsis sp. TaxID=37632 RepID=UPI002C7CE826|nr:hypothetical protein [Amycolatopsis sp.]HVV12621.1 hypothetical protein [Amycolatopsis sp.]
MSRTGHSQLVRWLLLAVVALGLILMHHAPAAQDGSGMHGGAAVVMPAASPPDADGMGAMLHECLAILGQFALGALLLLLVFAAGFARGPGVRRLPAPRAPDRPNTLAGRSLLASVCVLRL